jgi:magnesium chelatase family protein
MLIASMNPCPCGHLSDNETMCLCTPTQIRNYWNKLSGPLLDRLDLIVEVPRLKISDLTGFPQGELSMQIRARAGTAWQRQLTRNHKPNSNLTAKEARIFCALSSDAAALLKEAIYKFKLSGRAYDKILKVSRTIADLEGEPQIKLSHLAEALQYRFIERKGSF